MEISLGTLWWIPSTVPDRKEDFGAKYYSSDFLASTEHPQLKSTNVLYSNLQWYQQLSVPCIHSKVLLFSSSPFFRRASFSFSCDLHIRKNLFVRHDRCFFLPIVTVLFAVVGPAEPLRILLDQRRSDRKYQLRKRWYRWSQPWPMRGKSICSFSHRLDLVTIHRQ